MERIKNPFTPAHSCYLSVVLMTGGKNCTAGCRVMASMGRRGTGSPALIRRNLLKQAGYTGD